MYDWAEFRHFRYLLAVLESQGFRAAAELLHTSQPNLSVQAKQFQENASVRLYRKTKSGRIRVTESGVAFMSLARLLLETREQAIDALAAIEKGEIKSVRLGWAALADRGIFQDVCSLHRALLPRCAIRPRYGYTAGLAKEVVDGHIDAAIVTLPISHPELRIDVIRRDRLAVCIRRDDPRAMKLVLRPSDLHETPVVLCCPEGQPSTYETLLEMLNHLGVSIEEYSRASHPSEVQSLIKEGFGFALISENTPVDDALTTRSLVGLDWTLDTVAIYHRSQHPKTIPVVIKQLNLKHGLPKGVVSIAQSGDQALLFGDRIGKPPQPVHRGPDQLSLPSELTREKTHVA